MKPFLLFLIISLTCVASSIVWPNGFKVRPKVCSIEARAPKATFGQFTINEPNERGSRKNYAIRTDADFVTRDSRLGFIRKVYTIFGAQMVTTALVVYGLMNNPQLMSLVHENYTFISFASFLVSMIAIGGLVSFPQLRYRAPSNFILLGIHTLMQSIMVGAFTGLMDPKNVIVGAMHTLCVFLAITVYSFQPNPRYDLSGMGNTLLSILISLLVATIGKNFFQVPWMDNLLAGAGAVLFGVYLYVDMQRIIGGTHHKAQYGQKEYILAALNIYQDVISLFIEIVKILNKRDRDQTDNK